VDVEDLYLANRALIDRTISSISRRGHASEADAADFASATHLHLIDNGYAVLRAFRGRSELGAYLQAVIRRFFQDWRNANWGRWRPSAAVRRMGPIAMQLETLLVRDALSLEQAIEVMRTNHGVTLTAGELRTMASAFPPREMRTFVSDTILEEASAPGAGAESLIEDREAAAAARRISDVLDELMSSLTPDDQLILKLRFEDGVKVPAISRALGVEITSVYRRLERLLATLRSSLERAGISAGDARELIALRGMDLIDGDTSNEARRS
jgi:RNA polymerase sigma factor (sigma-70 family)